MSRPERTPPGIVPWVVLAVLTVAIAVLIGAAAISQPTRLRGASSGELSAGREPAALACAANDPLEQTLANGATWTMCWRFDPNQGLVLENIHFAPTGLDPVSIMASLSIGQLEVPYDTGVRTTEDITTQGFGGRNLQSLTGTECAGSRLAARVPDFGAGRIGGSQIRPVLCREVVDAGIAYRSRESGKTEAARTDAFRLATISKVGWYEYISQFTFGSDGSIRPELGATGDLSPEDYSDDHEHGWPVGPGSTDHAASHAHNVVWRVHWALGGHGGQSVEQYDAEPTGEFGPKSEIVDGNLTPITAEGTATAADRRWWRVINRQVTNRDRHPISYQIDLGRTDSFTFTADQHSHGRDHHDGYDIAFSQADDCQLFATRNKDGHCGTGVGDYIADRQQLDDVISWVAVGFHHVPRDEDQSPMELHWQGFTMAPRDLTAQRADPPTSRATVNGRPRRR